MLLVIVASFVTVHLGGGGRKMGKGSPYSITERPELIPVLCSQPAGDVSHKPGGRVSTELWTTGL